MALIQSSGIGYQPYAQTWGNPTQPWGLFSAIPGPQPQIPGQGQPFTGWANPYASAYPAFPQNYPAPNNSIAAAPPVTVTSPTGQQYVDYGAYKPQEYPYPAPAAPYLAGADTSQMVPALAAYRMADRDYKAASAQWDKNEQRNAQEWEQTYRYQYGGSTPTSGSTSLVNAAKTFTGQRYVDKVFDCSKFVQDAAKKLNINIPRSTYEQMPFFKKQGLFTSSLDKARPGDLIYFITGGGNPPRQHVGMYVGNDKSGRMMWIDNSPSHTIHVEPVPTRYKFIGVGQLSLMTKPQGDSKQIIPADFGWKGQTGVKGSKGKAPGGFQKPMYGALQKANKAMKTALGRGFAISSGYRSYDQQRKLNTKNPSKSKPAGQSVHGIGLAADLVMDRRQSEWLRQNASEFGLLIPDPKTEPWHVVLDPSQWSPSMGG